MTGSARSAAALLALLLALLSMCAAFAALGTWQIQRRTWKLGLIARVEQRVHAPPAIAPGPSEWPQVDAARYEYRHVRVQGSFLHERETLVQAATELGSGYWLLTPLRMANGAVVLVNRGYVPSGHRAGGETSGGIVVVTGLLRLSEPGGAFLRRNDAAANRWYSRDVEAIARARGLTGVAPYFIDADASWPARAESDGTAAPVGGLTVTSLPNNHLVYAITWYALALMAAGAAGYLIHIEWRLRRGRARAAAARD